MKIPTETQQAAAPQKVESDDTRAATAQQKKTAKPKKADRVELSASLDTQLSTRQAEQAQRVATIKSLVKSGKYRVSSLDVAEKMVSGSSDS